MPDDPPAGAGASAHESDGVGLFAALLVVLCVIGGVLIGLLLHGRGAGVAVPPTSTSTATSVPTTTAPPVADLSGLPADVRACVAGSGGELPAAGTDLTDDPTVAVCTKTSLTSFLQASGGLDGAAAACAADALVDQLSLARVLALLAGSPPSDDVRATVSAAMSGCR